MNMEFRRKLPIPQEVKKMYPVDDRLAKIKADRDEELKRIFRGESDKLILIIGPCSADNEDSVLDYISRLRTVRMRLTKKSSSFREFIQVSQEPQVTDIRVWCISRAPVSSPMPLRVLLQSVSFI